MLFAFYSEIKTHTINGENPLWFESGLREDKLYGFTKQEEGPDALTSFHCDLILPRAG